MEVNHNEPLNVLIGMKPLVRQIGVWRMTNSLGRIIGLPGVGKSQLFETLADWGPSVLPPDVDPAELPEGWKPKVHGFYVSQHDDTEFMYPFLSPDGEYTMVPSPIVTAPQMGDYFIADECTMEGCNRSLLKLFSGPRLTYMGYTGPRGITRIMIGNTADSGNYSFVDNPVQNNRMATVEWRPLYSDWLRQYAIPKGLHPAVIAAVQLEGQSLFLDWSSGRSRNSTPRSLTQMAQAMTGLENLVRMQEHRMPTDSEYVETMAGFAHDEAVLKVKSVMYLMNKLVPFTAIVADPSGVAIPDEAAARFMTYASVAKQATPQYWSQVMEFTNRLELEVRPSIVEGIVTNYPELKSTPEYQRYVADVSELIL